MKKHWIPAMLLSAVLIVAIFFISEITAFSMTPKVFTHPDVTPGEPWTIQEGDVFLMGVSLSHDSSLPVTFDSVAVRDTATGQPLDLDPLLYDEGREGAYKMIGAHCAPLEEIKAYFGEDYLLPVSGTKSDSRQMVLCLFWPEFPPWDHPIDIQVSYRVLGLIPKTEHVVYHWGTLEQEMETPSKSLLDWTKEGFQRLWNG